VHLLQKQIATSQYTNKLLENVLTCKDLSTKGEEQPSIRESFQNTFPNLLVNSMEQMLELEKKLSQAATRHLMVIKNLNIYKI